MVFLLSRLLIGDQRPEVTGENTLLLVLHLVRVQDHVKSDNFLFTDLLSVISGALIVILVDLQRFLAFAAFEA